MKFRLPDFRSHRALNEVREKMRAELIEWQVDTPTRTGRISSRDLKALETALEINIDDIKTQPNKSLTYCGEHVLLYIMQPRHFKEKVREPKYHISNCSTWFSMKEKGRKDRYVVSRRVDGMFELDIPSYDGCIVREERRLRVCRNCLDNVGWKGYSTDNPRRNAIFEAFNLSEFFEVQKQSHIKEKPKFTSATMPSAGYTDDFDKISSAARAAANWKCMDCGLSLSKTFERRFLHAHHISGNKGDNTKENLRVLCLGCHANQPDHRHMKKLQEFKVFEQLYGSRDN